MGGPAEDGAPGDLDAEAKRPAAWNDPGMSTGLQKQDLVRQFLRRSVTGAPVRIPFARDIVLASMHVAGTAYYEAAAVAGGLRSGQRLTLRREPGNVHDALAIEVLEPGGRSWAIFPAAAMRSRRG